MQYAGKKLRHELKYIISTGEYRCLKARLEAAMSADAHTADGGERVRSLYFDDVFDSVFLSGSIQHPHETDICWGLDIFHTGFHE